MIKIHHRLKGSRDTTLVKESKSEDKQERTCDSNDVNSESDSDLDDLVHGKEFLGSGLKGHKSKSHAS